MSKPVSCLALALCTHLAADTPSEGYSSEPLATVPFMMESVTLSSGDFLALGYNTLGRYAPDGTFLETVHTFATQSIGPVYLAVNPSETVALACRFDGSLGGTYIVDLETGEETFVIGVGEGAVFLDDHHAVIRDTISIFSGQNELLRLDVTDGTSELLASINGPFGPIALTPEGGLLVAYQDMPVFRGPFQVGSLTAAQLQSGVLLETNDLTPLPGTFESPTDLLADVDGRGFYVLQEPSSGPPGVFHAYRGVRKVFELAAAEEPAGMELIASPGGAAFLPFQPLSGGTLVVHTREGSNRFDPNHRKAVRPARPVASAAGPGTTGPGSLNLALSGGPTQGAAVFFLGSLALYEPNEPIFQLQVPVAFGIGSPTRLPGVLLLDDAGARSVTLQNTQGVLGLVFQALVVDSGLNLVGSSTAASF